MLFRGALTEERAKIMSCMTQTYGRSKRVFLPEDGLAAHDWVFVTWAQTVLVVGLQGVVGLVAGGVLALDAARVVA